MLIYELIL